MVQIIIGILALIFGLFRLDDGFGIILIGVGAFLIVNGYKKLQVRKHSTRINSYFVNSQSELSEKLRNSEYIDNIAGNLFAYHKIPLLGTYNFYADLLNDRIRSSDSQIKNEALELLSFHKSSFSEHLNGHSFPQEPSVVTFDASARLYAEHKTLNGFLLLSQFDILFFKKSTNWGKVLLERGWDKLYESPVFFLPLIIDFIGDTISIRNNILKPVSKAKLKALEKLFRKEKYFHIPLAEIKTIEVVKRNYILIAHSCILVTNHSGKQLCVGTSESNGKEWVNEITRQIKVVALAKGNNLF